VAFWCAGAKPAEIDPGLFAMQWTLSGGRARWADLQRLTGGTCSTGAASTVTAPELTVCPEADEGLAMLELARPGGQRPGWDALVVGWRRPPKTLRLLALPGACLVNGTRLPDPPAGAARGCG